jgi:hypothetical protein
MTSAWVPTACAGWNKSGKNRLIGLPATDQKAFRRAIAAQGVASRLEKPNCRLG